MSNDLQHFTPEYWSPRIQALLRALLVGKSLANFEERSTLVNGDKVHRPRYQMGNPVDYVKNVGFAAFTDITTTDEFLTVDQSKILPFFIDKIDKIQNKYKTANEFIKEAAYRLRKEIDGDLFNQFDQAAQVFDDGDIGGTIGNPIALSTTNVIKTISKSKAKLRRNNVETDKAWALVMGPDALSTLEQQLSSTGYKFGDDVLRMGFWNGRVGSYLGLDIWESTNLTFTAELVFTAQPATTNTITINGVVVTFISVLAGAGQVKIAGSAALTLDNLVALLNDPLNAAGSAEYQAFSTTDADKLYGLTASDGATFLGIEFKGNSEVVLAEAITDAADVWRKQVSHAILMQVGAIDQVIQDEVNVETIQNPINPATGKQLLGQEFIPNTLYGTKTFTEGAERMLDVQIEFK